MKKLFIIPVLLLTFFFFTATSADAISVIKLGKGGVVILPNGSYKLCPQFSFRKCCKITFTWGDIWKWITDDGCWNDDINSKLPIKGNAVVFNDLGTQIGSYDVNIIWINPTSCAKIKGDEIIIDNGDIQLDVLK
ncbi:MAG: hypothetical protein IMY70_00180 [Bacteroidetes bacterium]|nr:hypothetical protein [Bacteroidota bacterium]